MKRVITRELTRGGRRAARDRAITCGATRPDCRRYDKTEDFPEPPPPPNMMSFGGRSTTLLPVDSILVFTSSLQLTRSGVLQKRKTIR